MKTRIFHVTLFLLMLLITPAFSFAAPNIFYTDIISGPNTGGENNKGIYLSVFGKNFGSSGLGTTVKVYINNIEVDNYRYLGTSFGRSDIQQITVQIGAIGNPAPGTPLPIKVVVNSAESNTNHTFTVQPGDIRFVDNVSGNDATAVKNDITRPWRYVQTPSEGGVLSTSVTRPGDVIVMRGRGALWSDVGFDNRFARFRHATGTAPNGVQGSGPITIMAYPGEDVHIKPSSNTSGGIHGIGYSYPEFSDWITVSGLRIEGGDRTVNDGPINLQANSDNWRIVNNELFDWFAEDGSQGTEAKAGGIAGNGKNVAIMGNHIHHIGGGTLNHGIYLDTGATNVEIAYNNMHNMTGGNIIQTFDNLGTADLKNISIHHNLMHDGSRYGLNLSGGTDSAIAWNNIIYNTAFAGVRLSIAGSSNAEIHVIHNTLYNNNTVNGGDGRAPIVNSWNLTQRPVFVKNNIIYSGPFSTSYYTNYGSGSAVLDRNLYFGLSIGLVPQQDANPVGGTDLNNPLFSDPGSGNFHLQAGSPAIDQATDNQPFTLPNDYDLVARPQGVRADTGALEYVGGGGGNAAPTVTLSANTTSGNAPLTVNFTANASDPDGTISQYEWDLDGNGTYETANTNSTRAYTYNSAGTYNARVRVTDNSASTATSVVTITVSTASGGGNGGNTGGGGGDSSASGGSGCGIIKKPNDKSTGSGLKAIDIGIASLLLLMLFYKLRKLYKINFWIVFVFFIITITIAINVEAATLEVGAGKTYSTIQAAANAANAGDTILVFPGTYNERITLPSGKTGTAGNKIIFKSQTSRAAFMNGFDTGNANYLRIEGFDISYNVGGWYGGGIWINNSSYVDIVDNYFHDIPGQAINPNWSSGVTHNNIYVANNKIYRVNQGIIARGNDWLVENNDIERLVGTFYDADYTRFFGENITFRNNYFHGTFQNEIGTSHTDGFQTFAVNPGEYAKNIIIEGNVVRDFYHQGLMLEGKTGTHDNLIVRNNIFADAASWGVAAHGIANLQVLNNNFVNMLIHGVGFRAANDGTPTTGVVQNNIFYNGGTNYWKETTCTGCTLTGGYNIITIEKYPYYKESTDLIGVDPLFINISGYNFHLQSGSPAIDAGTSSVAAVVTTDIEGNTRPIGAGYDIGAYEMADPNAPSVQITSPTAGNTYPSSGTYTGDLALSGTATPVSGRSISSVSCTNGNGGSCVCSGTTNWTCNTSISSGQTNINITVKAIDNNNSSGIDVLVVNPSSGGGNGGDTGGNTSNSSGGDSSASGGSGCGYIKDDNGKGQKAKGEGEAFAIMLIMTLSGITLARRIFSLKEFISYKYISVFLTIIFVTLLNNNYLNAENTDRTKAESVCSRSDIIICENWEDGDHVDWMDWTDTASWGGPIWGGHSCDNAACRYPYPGYQSHQALLAFLTQDTFGTIYPTHYTPGLGANDTVYARWYVRWSQGFEYNTSNNKNFFLFAGNNDYSFFVRPFRKDPGRFQEGIDDPKLASPYIHMYCSQTDAEQDPNYAAECAYSGGDLRYFPNVAGYESFVMKGGPEFYCVEMMVTPNPTGQSWGGKLKFWIDEVLMADYPNVSLRHASDSTPIDRVMISSYWGGGGVTSLHPDQFVVYDNIVVSKSYIGCNGSGGSGGSGNAPPPSSGSGGDSGGGSSGGSGCGFVKDDDSGRGSKGQSGRVTDIGLMIMLVLILSGIALRKIITELKMRCAFFALIKGLCFFVVTVLLALIAACGGGGDVGESGSQQPGGPVTLSYSPEGNAIGVPLSVMVVVTASAPLDPSSVNTSTLYLVGPGGHVPSAITYSNNTATLTPSAPLQAGVSHTAVATTGIRNTSGAAVLAANHSWTFTTAAGDLPPLFARWESDMTTYGAQWGEFQNPNGPNGWAVRFDRAYYDVLNIMHQIKTYTGQSQPWDTYIGYAKYAYRNEYYRTNDYRVPGYRRFAHGLLADYLAGGDTTIDDIRKIRDIPAFSNLSEYNGAYAGSHQVMSREMAYALEAHIAAEKAGEPRQTQVSQFVTWMENHLHEWKSGQFAAEAWFQPFMFGISAQALIEFHEWEVANNRDPNASWPKTHWPTIPAALSDFSDWMYNTAVVRDGPDVGQRMWAANYQNSGYGGFRYMDRNNTSISAEGSSVTPDLNALIAPVYAWVYKQTGSAAHRAMSDEVFAGGVYYSGASWGGKQFNQSYRWSFNYIKWRQEGQAKWGN